LPNHQGRRDSYMQQLQVREVRRRARIEDAVFVSIDVHFEPFDHVSVVKLQKALDLLVFA